MPRFYENAPSERVASMKSVLVVRPSSLGDIVYALALTTDIRRRHPHAVIDWVSEPGFAPLVRLAPAIRNVIPFGLRRWRRAPLARETWRDVRAFAQDLRRTRYDVVLDLQEQVKGALIARLARGTRHGFDAASIREPLATLGDDVHHRVSRDLHFLARCRRLAALALDLDAGTPPRWHLQPPQHAPAMPDRPYAMLLHGTSRDDKLWPEAHWRRVQQALAGAGLAMVLPWGSAAEEARSHRLADGIAGAVVPPWLSLPDAAALLSHARLAIGVDTGFTHLAAALRTPTIALFTATEPGRHGVAATGSHGIDLGDREAMPPPDVVIDAIGRSL
jgi:heptosyltransferase-1